MNLTNEQKRDIYNNFDDHSMSIDSEIDSFIDVIEKDLLISFEDIEKKAHKRAREYVSNNSYSDYITEDNYEDAIYADMVIEEDALDMEYNYAYNIYPKMKQDFLNIIVVWLYHLYEKDCKNFFNYRDKEKIKFLKITGFYKNGKYIEAEIKVLSEYIGIEMKPNSNWFKINTELRLLNNSIKHSLKVSDKLKSLRPDLIIEGEIKMTFEEIKKYAEAMKSLWTESDEKKIKLALN